MYLALIEHGRYLDFINPVPFSGPDGVIERGVLNGEGRISGRAQAAVRPISAADFTTKFSRKNGWMKFSANCVPAHC